MILVIGSIALRDILGTNIKCTDTDLVCSKEDALNYIRNRELSIVKCSSTKVVCKHNAGNIIEIYFNEVEPFKTVYELGKAHKTTSVNFYGDIFVYPSLDFLYSLKMSHRFKDHTHFDKTMSHIKLMESNGAKLIDDDRFKFLEEAFTKKPVSLKQSADNFFRETDGFYILNHDDIHKAIVKHKRPAYEMIIAGEVWCEMKKFDSLPFIDKLSCSVEESFVLAIERAILPNYGTDYSTLKAVDESELKKAYQMAVRKLSTKIASGKFREFTWRNYDLIVSLFDFSYYKNFLEEHEENKIKKFR